AGPTEPPAKRPRVEAEGSPAAEMPEDTDELVPAYMDELMIRLAPEGLPVMQDVLDDAVLWLQAEEARAAAASGAGETHRPPGSPQPGTSTGGETGPAGKPDLDLASRQLYADIEAMTDSLSDEDIDTVLHSWDREMNPDQ
ncbi:hypothetical protein PQR71_42545, partial [Paraburkholderia fungorum]|uniref:hypothetical protein n=1 Tax=Paraburkholderia fungorum TaxID=134537 RepID=UPI0038BC44B8